MTCTGEHLKRWTIMRNELKMNIPNCPHCKNSSTDFLSLKSVEAHSLLLHDNESTHYQVHCEICGAYGPLGRTKEEAITLWKMI